MISDTFTKEERRENVLKKYPNLRYLEDPQPFFYKPRPEIILTDLLEPHKRRVKKGFCGSCEMRLKGWHQLYPCAESELERLKNGN